MSTRRFIVTLLFLLLAGVSAGVYAAISSAPQNVPAPAAIARIERGSAAITRGSDTFPVGARTELLPDDRILTVFESRVLITFYDSFDAVLDGDSSVRVAALRAGAPFTGRDQSVLLLERGRMYAQWRDPGITAVSRHAVEAGALRILPEPGQPAQAVATVADSGQARIESVSDVRPLRYWSRDPLTVEPKTAGSLPGAGVLIVNPYGRIEQRRTTTRPDPLQEVFVEDAVNIVEQRQAVTRDAARAALALLAGPGRPSGPAYRLKRVGESVRLALTTDPGSRAALQYRFRERRLAESMLFPKRTPVRNDLTDESCYWYAVAQLSAIAECTARGAGDSSLVEFEALPFFLPPPAPPPLVATGTPALPLTPTSTVVQ